MIDMERNKILNRLQVEFRNNREYVPGVGYRQRKPYMVDGEYSPDDTEYDEFDRLQRVARNREILRERDVLYAFRARVATR
ncbi:MAG: hypothetical protein QMD97_01780 [Candidatus Aenigmarchaeota archaeon]|nr:hypothetical protein [Candidatus Aenigmarchaeota archaeon]